jgi:hypothetical protein
MKAIAKVIKKITISSIVLFGLVTILSCSADDGKDGATGTANVIYSDWVNAPAATPETIDGTNGMSTSLNAPKLTEEILNNGTILVYMDFGGGIYQLPYTSTAGGSANTIKFISTLGKIKIFRFKHSADGTTIGLPTFLRYRYILIPGGVSATDGKSVKIDYSKMSYEDVCARLNVKP